MRAECFVTYNGDPEALPGQPWGGRKKGSNGPRVLPRVRAAETRSPVVVLLLVRPLRLALCSLLHEAKHVTVWIGELRKGDLTGNFSGSTMIFPPRCSTRFSVASRSLTST